MFIEIIFIVTFMSISIKVKMSDSDEDPEITSGLKKDGFNVTNSYFNFHFNKSLLCRICNGCFFKFGVEVSIILYRLRIMDQLFKSYAFTRVNSEHPYYIVHSRKILQKFVAK
jgi:hypothetical protein